MALLALLAPLPCQISAPAQPPGSPYLKGYWKVNRSKIKSFDFSLPRAPLVNLQSLTLNEVTANRVSVEAVFGLEGSAIGQETPFQFQVKDASKDSTGWWVTMHQGGVRTSQSREATFTLEHLNPFTGRETDPHLISFTGRASADNRWPLAFEIEPFNYNKAKAGQKLKFKSWPAPLPPNAKSQH